MIQIPQTAIDALRVLLADHLRVAYRWDGVEPWDSADIDEWNLVEFVYAAVEFVLEAYPFRNKKGAATRTNVERDPSNPDLFSALLDLEPQTLDALVLTVVRELKLEVTTAPAFRALAAPRVYKHQPHPWPDILGSWVGEREVDAWGDHTFGVVSERGWLKSAAQRKAVFAAVDPTYHQLTLVEIDRRSASRLAAFLLAGFENKGAFKRFAKQAEALVSVLGSGSRCFSNRDLDEDELHDPFAHGETVDLGTSDTCAGGSLLVLLVVDEWRVVRLESLWDRWTEY